MNRCYHHPSLINEQKFPGSLAVKDLVVSLLVAQVLSLAGEFLFFLFFFRAKPVAHGSSKARG